MRYNSSTNVSMADLGEGPGLEPLFWVKKKKWLKGEKPAGQVNQNRPPHPLPAP